MTKAELIDLLVADTGMAKADLDKVLTSLASWARVGLVNDQTFTLPGIVKLTPKLRAARTGRNPRTGEAVEVPAKRIIAAKVSVTLAKAVA